MDRFESFSFYYLSKYSILMCEFSFYELYVNDGQSNKIAETMLCAAYIYLLLQTLFEELFLMRERILNIVLSISRYF